MSDDTLKIKKRLSTLSSSLDELENGLAAMLSQSLPELLLGLDTIQQAKLQVVIPYLVYDLVFVYLKTKGLDPKTHPVVAELDRVRQYFDKIKDSEDPAKRQFAIDRAAATRFIKHAIAQAKDAPPTPTPEPGPSTRVPLDTEGTADTVPVPVKVTEKMLEREQYQRALREEEREEDSGGDLKVIDGEEEDDEQQSEDDSPGQAAPPAAKGKSRASPPETGIGKRRPPIDPFAGYGGDPKPRPLARLRQARRRARRGHGGRLEPT
ncbi:hypothetical protein EDB92DRAFT_1813852 [Lactarius akahatsu]|uniref:Exosome complex protein n=1 Tax=Lactarius akahatsu TaxID=416441 RepID=A0AAD4LLD8_9AGAM|nr:hypothetical protein EDB92DRAFT_1813852 [Lactarius akahatsu]